MRTIRAKSGIKGWQDKLQKVYKSFEEFESFCKYYNIHKRIGFKTIKGAWRTNPTMQGSVNPSDLKRIK